MNKQFARAPHFTGTLGLAWMPAAFWSLSAQVRHHGGYFSDDANTPALRIDTATVVDARAAYDRKKWSVFAYGRNVLDTFYLTSLFSPLRGAAGDPREFGLGVEVRF
jgi:outer membrane receptor protein involved in Fe transport